MQLDETDRALIAALRQNSRTSLADLARGLGLARTTVTARLDRLERSGTITGYTVTLSAQARPPLRATALVSVEPRSAPGVIQRLRSLTQVTGIHTTSGRFDLLVTLEAHTTEELDQTLDRIGEARGVRSSESLIHLSTKLDRHA